MPKKTQPKIEYTKKGKPKAPALPIKPLKPLKPQKFYETKMVAEVMQYNFPLTLQDLINKVKKYTNNFSKVKIQSIDNCDDYGDHFYGFKFIAEGKFKNENYEKELKIYERESKQYNKQMEKYEEKYTQYLIQKQAFDEWQLKFQQEKIDKQMKKLQREKKSLEKKNAKENKA